MRRVAVCGGAGDDLFDAVRASGADAYVTADLRHHPASEARETPATAGRPGRRRALGQRVALAGRLRGGRDARSREGPRLTDPWSSYGGGPRVGD